MKLAILGDIHGNRDALRAVLKSAKSHDVTRLIITGDLVGYYPFVKDVLDLISYWQCDLVMGNHEVMMQKSINDQLYLSKITEKYGSGLRDSMKKLTKKNIQFLLSLPFSAELEILQQNFLLSHGAPWNTNHYIYPDSVLNYDDWVPFLKFDFVICGHTHYPMKREIAGLTIVNPGSVGQPRNQGSGAHWLLYDSVNRIFDFKVEDYDISKISNWAKSNNFHLPYLHEVFAR